MKNIIILAMLGLLSAQAMSGAVKSSVCLATDGQKCPGRRCEYACTRGAPGSRGSVCKFNGCKVIGNSSGCVSGLAEYSCDPSQIAHGRTMGNLEKNRHCHFVDCVK